MRNLAQNIPTVDRANALRIMSYGVSFLFEWFLDIDEKLNKEDIKRAMEMYIKKWVAYLFYIT